ASARFDRISHIVPSYQIAGSCQQYAEAPAAGCDGHFAAFGGGGSSAKAAGSRGGAASKRAKSGAGGSHRRKRHRRHRSGSDIPRRAAGAAASRSPTGQAAQLPAQILHWLLQP
ncbi:MAG: hypothetical protein QOD53_1057, partial [Thermoleophilaceae bacterium]|nr:hypothetical protein [Thermoleophilaceae bacterium]